MQDVLARYGGALERFGPEGLVAVFGGDKPRDDDALRAVRAAAELGLPAGIATGESVAGAGSVFARAAELARGSGVQADERTRSLVQHERRLDAPLVGRTEELRAPCCLRRGDEERAAGSSPSSASPGSERPGSLGSSWSPSRTPRTPSSAAASRTARALTFMPLLDALRDLDVSARWRGARRRAGLGASCCPRRREGCGHPRRVVLGRAPAARGARPHRPVLLILDDVHWAEPALLDLVDYLGERITDAPLLSLPRPPGARTAAGDQWSSARWTTRRRASSWRASQSSTRRRLRASSCSPRGTRSTPSSSPPSRPRAARACRRRSRPCSRAGSAGSPTRAGRAAASCGRRT